MNIPPAILDLRISPPDRHPIHIWLPLFLLWPVVLVLALLTLIFTILTDVVLLILGQPYHHYTILVARSLAALTDARGMVMSFTDKQTSVDMTVQ